MHRKAWLSVTAIPAAVGLFGHSRMVSQELLKGAHDLAPLEVGRGTIRPAFRRRPHQIRWRKRWQSPRFGFNSGAALATVVGVLIEVPVMLTVVWIVNSV